MKNPELTTSERNKPWWDITAQEAARNCLRLPNAGAQSTAFRLPPQFNHDLSISGKPEETIEMPRTLKIAHLPWEIDAAVANMNIDSQDARVRKAVKLSVDNHVSTTWTIQATRLSPRLEQLFGHPLLVRPQHSTLIPGDYHFAYAQDLGHPLWERFAQLDPEHNEEDLRIACRFVDLYIDAELFLCSKAIFDPTFKILDNCATSTAEDPQLFSENNNFMITDLGELILYNLSDVLSYIHRKAWRNTAFQPEYTPLTPTVRAYFDEAFDARLTEDAVRNIWGTNMGIEPCAAGEHADMVDLPILSDIAALIRQAKTRPQYPGQIPPILL